MANRNVSHEYATCAAYYAIVASSVQKSGDQETADAYIRIYEDIITMAVLSAQVGRSEEMAMNVSKARLNREMDAMEGKIEHDYSNIALLIEVHHKRCEFVNNNADELIDEWRQKITAKYSKQQD